MKPAERARMHVARGTPNLTRRISNETQRYVNHRVSALDPLLFVSPGGRHRPRVRTGRALRTSLGACSSWSSGCTERWCSPNGDRGTVIMLLGSLLSSGRPRPPHEGEGCRHRGRIANSSGDFFFVWTLHRARRDRALLRHPLSARTVEPAMAPRGIENNMKRFSDAGIRLKLLLVEGSLAGKT